MQDLSAQFAPISLAPSSQEGGNMIQEDLAKMTMTAPGSEPVAPLPAAVEGSHPEVNYSGPQVPVSHPGRQKKATAAQMKASGAGRYGDTHGVPAASLWKETS